MGVRIWWHSATKGMFILWATEIAQRHKIMYMLCTYTFHGATKGLQAIHVLTPLIITVHICTPVRGWASFVDGHHLPIRWTIHSCWHRGHLLFCLTQSDMQQLWNEWLHSPHTTTHSSCLFSVWHLRQASMTWTLHIAQVSHSTSQLHIATMFHFFSVKSLWSDFAFVPVPVLLLPTPTSVFCDCDWDIFGNWKSECAAGIIFNWYYPHFRRFDGSCRSKYNVCFIQMYRILAKNRAFG